jgi:DNA-directed RNA polymerase specialized sigma24 family protein
MSEGVGSVTHWIRDLRDGNDVDSAARGLWRRYFDQLVRLARARLHTTSRGPADEEDVALSAFDSFCRGIAAGRFTDLGSRDDLWRLLVVLTARKAVNEMKHERRQKRGGGRVVGQAALDGSDPDGDALGRVMGREPSPELAVMIVDECRRLLGSLRDDSLRRVALLKMEGYSHEEIATRLDCGLRTVERKLGTIRATWLADEPT